MNEPTERPIDPTYEPPIPASEPFPPARLKAERVQLALVQLPGWALSPDGLALVRIFALDTREAALALACLISEICRARGHEAALLLEGARLTATLSSPAAGGVTEADLEIARQLAFQG